MKILQRAFLVLLVAVLAACSNDDDNQDVTPELPPEEVEGGINIPDPVLASALHSFLGVPEGEPITAEDMLSLTEFSMGAEFDLFDLTGLEYATNLEYFRIGETQVTDLSPVSGLRNITYFRINDTNISDLSPISEYTTLTYFNANTAVNIADISPLAGNTGLQELILREVPMGNEGLETIANFTSLYRLNIRETGVTDVTILGEMMAAGALLDTTPGAAEVGGADVDLRGLEVSDWTPIAPYVGQIAVLDGPTATTEIGLTDEVLAAEIRSVLGLEESVELNSLYLLSIDTLDLEGSDVADLSGLDFAENLVYLHLGETQVTDLSPISDLSDVQYLRINETEITDLSPISNYTSLTYFNANRTTGIADISPLALNTGLQELILREVPFGDAGMATLANFTALYRLNMRETDVTDITVLGQLMEQGALLDTTPGAEANGGADLDLRNLDVNDWSPIEPYIDQISNLEGYPG